MRGKGSVVGSGILYTIKWINYAPLQYNKTHIILSEK